MAIPHYLAMTAAEMADAASLPEKTAWMACHFSPYSTGLGNLPQKLPQGSLLILNDRTPIHGHDPERVTSQLKDTIRRLGCSGLLLDFQNPRNEENAALAKYIAKNIACPIGITPEYHVDGAAVFLPPVPTDTPVDHYLKPWKAHTVWLETALDGLSIEITEKGAAFSVNRLHALTPVHTDPELHCHYSIAVTETAVVFRSWRTPSDLQALLDEAENIGIKNAVGLYQELG